MAEILSLFPTRVYRALLEACEALNADIVAAAEAFAVDDHAGRAWCAANRYPGYTSYGTPGALTDRAPVFAELRKRLDRHVAGFAEKLALDLGGRRLRLDNMWVNVLKPGGFHTGHIHPHSVVSGTYYVRAPAGAAALKFEDPRHGLMMAAPPRRADAPETDGPFMSIEPLPGLLLLWESWLRHEVVRNDARGRRISVSFNYRWG